MGAQPWPELELHGRPWGALRREGEGGEEEEGEGAQIGGGMGAARGRPGEGARSSSAPAIFVFYLLYVRRNRT
jgi:hypothetical protein